MSESRFCGERLEEIRKSHHLTQKQLAKVVGVEEKTISDYECGKTAPRVQKLIRLAETLDISTDYLLGLTEDEIPASQIQYITLSREYPSRLKEELLDYLELLKLKYVNSELPASSAFIDY